MWFLAATFGGDRYITVNRRLSFADARTNCKALGAKLVSVHSANENSFLNNLITNGFPFKATEGSSIRDHWIGFSTTDDCSCFNQYETQCERCRDHWSWTDGTVADYRQFDAKHPLGGSRSCASMKYRDGDWFSVNCVTELRSICKEGNGSVPFFYRIYRHKTFSICLLLVHGPL